MTPIFRGRVDKGKIIFQNRSMVNTHIHSFKNGTLVEIIIRRFRKTKSDPLRRYYFGVVVKMLSENLGYEKEEVHDAMKARFAARYDDNGLMIIPSVFSNKSKMSIQEKQDFIEQIKRWAAGFLLLYIPDPNEVEYKEKAA